MLLVLLVMVLLTVEVALASLLILLLSSVEHIPSALRSRRINTLVGLSGTLQNGPKPVTMNRQQRWDVVVDVDDEKSQLLLVVDGPGSVVVACIIKRRQAV